MSQSFLLRALAVKTGSPITKLLLVKLADNADHQGVCFPSYEYLASTCEISLRTAKQHVKKLVELGLLTKTRRFSQIGKQRSNVYQLSLPSSVESESRKQESICGDAADAHITKNKNINNLEGGRSGAEVIRLMASDGEMVLYQEFVDVLKQSYPQIDIEKELNAIRVWLYLNEDKRKPADTIKFFVNTWLRRAAAVKQNKRAVVQAQPTASRVGQTAAEKVREDYRQRKEKHPIESRIQALVRSKKQGERN